MIHLLTLQKNERNGLWTERGRLYYHMKAMREYYVARYPLVPLEHIDAKIVKEYPLTCEEEERCERLAIANKELVKAHNEEMMGLSVAERKARNQEIMVAHAKKKQEPAAMEKQKESTKVGRKKKNQPIVNDHKRLWDELFADDSDDSVGKKPAQKKRVPSALAENPEWHRPSDDSEPDMWDPEDPENPDNQVMCDADSEPDMWDPTGIDTF